MNRAATTCDFCSRSANGWREKRASACANWMVAFAGLAMIASHARCGAGTIGHESGGSGPAKMAARPGTLRLVEHRTPAGLSVRILDGERAVFEGICGTASLLLIEPTGRAAVAYPESKRTENQLLLSGGNTNG